MQASSGIKTEFLMTKTLLDLARLAGNVQGGSLYALKLGSKHRLLFPAEKVGKNTIMFYYDVEKIGSYGVYSRQERETFEFVASISNMSDLQSRRIRVIELDGNPFGKPAPKDDVSMLKLMHYEDIVKGVMYRSVAEEEAAQSVYRFDFGGGAFVCTFNQIDHEAHALVYAQLDDARQFSFFRYNYAKDSVTRELAPRGTPTSTRR